MLVISYHRETISHCHPERGARERARESKDPGAVSSAIAASRRSPQTVSVELPIAAWSQLAPLGILRLRRSLSLWLRSE